ncbi:CCR4-NOT transcription complex subunit 4, partial [Ascosphaera atra]
MRSGPNSPAISGATMAKPPAVAQPVVKDLSGPTPAEAASAASQNAQKKKEKEDREREKEEKRDRKAKEKEREKERERLEKERQKEQEEKERKEQEEAAAAAAPTTSTTPKLRLRREDVILNNLLQAVSSPAFKFVFSTDGIPEEDLEFLRNHACLIDPYGGVKRRAMRERAEQEKAKLEAEIRSNAAAAAAAAAAANAPQTPAASDVRGTEESAADAASTIAGGSSQLGGEPEEAHVGSQIQREGSVSAIRPPSQASSQ